MEYISLSIYLSSFFEVDGMSARGGGESRNRGNLSFASVMTTSFSPSVCWRAPACRSSSGLYSAYKKAATPLVPM
jgi:hypothetical protein